MYSSNLSELFLIGPSYPNINKGHTVQILEFIVNLKVNIF